jgi:hypothetical protein
MNDRIKQLITKADTYAWSIAEKYVTRDCCHDGEVNYLWEDAFREKFAELIVQECAGVCEDYRGTEWGKAAECIGDSIKEHFGVEE